MFIYARRIYNRALLMLTIALVLFAFFVYAKKKYAATAFGKEFYAKAEQARNRLDQLNTAFELCAGICHTKKQLLKAIVFPEVMRYSEWKDDIETESLRVLYVQFGKEYADFSVGLFQMKPSFAEQVEEKARLLLPVNIYNELQLGYQSNDAQIIRQERIDRLRDADWQLVYLTSFVALCNEWYKDHCFSSELERLQWYATVYNAGLDRSNEYIAKKISQEQFYFIQGMPGKKFRYAALATYAYEHMR
jgi:hypothetical protein